MAVAEWAQCGSESGTGEAEGRLRGAPEVKVKPLDFIVTEIGSSGRILDKWFMYLDLL